MTTPKPKMPTEFSPEVETAAYVLCAKLGESEPLPHAHMKILLHFHGMEMAWAVFEEAKKLRKKSRNIKVPGTERNRSFGGVFFLLFKQRLGEEVFNVSFRMATKMEKKRRKAVVREMRAWVKGQKANFGNNNGELQAAQ